MNMAKFLVHSAKHNLDQGVKDTRAAMRIEDISEAKQKQRAKQNLMSSLLLDST